ncbi:hypothetical protein [uncultured Tenacibaculum sp.]|uniref:hypothetical protein n=1 Tax=uncultured Tenacibaculum sp. TaxID=174713 RepID=UPI002629D90B|nr:hypothetical protein [uncultured Tenacibaculum sp.]
MNRIVRYLLYLIVFCLITLIINDLFKKVKGQNIETIDYYLSTAYGFIMWLYYLFSGRLKKTEKKKG